jgi:hypothetical protein
MCVYLMSGLDGSGFNVGSLYQRSQLSYGNVVWKLCSMCEARAFSSYSLLCIDCECWGIKSRSLLHQAIAWVSHIVLFASVLQDCKGH